MRSKAVKNEVLKLDNYHGQIVGFNGEDLEERGQLEVHHIVALGMGGSDELDTVDNCITLHGRVHRLIHDGKLHIEKFDRENKILEISDETFHVITRDSKALKKLLGITALYFHNRELFDMLLEAQERVCRKTREEREDARDMWALRLNDSFDLMDPTAKSFPDYALSLGWSPGRANRFASLWECSENGDIKWDVGESATDFGRRLTAAGVVKSQTFWYVMLNLKHRADTARKMQKLLRDLNVAKENQASGRMDEVELSLILDSAIHTVSDALKAKEFELSRTQDGDKLRESLEDGEALVRVGKFISGLRFKKDEGLTNWKGEPIKYDVI